jgi:hypothetical protein
MQLIELSTGSSSNSDFKRKHLIIFWVDVSEEYDQLSEKSLKYLLPFTNTQLVERAFSSYISTATSLMQVWI